jgi:hypothetical protein
MLKGLGIRDWNWESATKNLALYLLKYITPSDPSLYPTPVITYIVTPSFRVKKETALYRRAVVERLSFDYS